MRPWSSAGMKKFAYVVLTATALSFLAISSAPAASQKAAATQAAQPKITKADAQRIVMQKNPGANVVSTTETTVAGHKVWALSVITTGGNVSKKIYVDQETGKITH